MQFPNCGKVLVIDDTFTEALPLLKLLTWKGVPAMYHSGNRLELPASPFHEIRLVFCDLKFYGTTDAKSVASNVLALLNAFVAKDNGPYIFLVWSAHGDDYLETLKEALSTSEIKPEFILQLSKADYFSRKADESVFDSIIEELPMLNLDPTDEESVKNLIIEKANQRSGISLQPHEDALKKIEEKLLEELKKANLFHLFVIWENAIASSAVQTVNSIYAAIPETIPRDKRLRAMLYYLAKFRLEKQMDTAEEKSKFDAAIASLNEMFSYFYSDSMNAMSLETIGIEKIQHLDEVRSLSASKFNQWKMIAPAVKGPHPGNVFRDDSKHFQYHGMITADIHNNNEKYNEIKKELESNEETQYILVDISADCDIAQRKLFLSRLVPGIMILKSDYDRYCAENKIKNNTPDYIFRLSPVEVKAKEWCILLNVNQLFADSCDALPDEKCLFSFTRTYITELKQKSATCISRHGIEVFSA